MPYKKESSKKRKLSPAAVAYLSDDRSILEPDFTLWCYRRGVSGFDWDPEPDQLWRDHKNDFLPHFITEQPGRRPLSWWHWEAPEPRKRIGGKGQLLQEYVPFYSYGVPQHWDPNSIDPDDPLIFESQAFYLSRHGLLTQQEKVYLEKHPEEMMPEKFIFYEDANDGHVLAPLRDAKINGITP